MESFRHMPLENIQNCRDLGGYPIKGGGFTKYGRLLRCGRPRASTPNDMEFFREYGIKNVFDLRGDSEAISMPSEFADYPGVNYYHFSLLEINPASPHMEMSMPEVYVTSARATMHACSPRCLASKLRLCSIAFSARTEPA